MSGNGVRHLFTRPSLSRLPAEPTLNFAFRGYETKGFADFDGVASDGGVVVVSHRQIPLFCGLVGAAAGGVLERRYPPPVNPSLKQRKFRYFLGTLAHFNLLWYALTQ